MPTITEVIAAKKAAAVKQAGAAAWAGERRDPEFDEVMERLKPMGKPKAAAIVLSASTPLPPADVAQKSHYAEQRSLSCGKGEAIPIVPANADQEVATWHEAMNSFESSLCVMRDPKEPETVWLAIRPDRDGLPPLLVYRLPWLLWDHPTASHKPEPF